MKQSNFSPVVLLILGCVPFLLMLVQWGAEDIMGMGRVIDNMIRWEVLFQIGVEMLLLGIILWSLDTAGNLGRNK